MMRADAHDKERAQAKMLVDARDREHELAMRERALVKMLADAHDKEHALAMRERALAAQEQGPVPGQEAGGTLPESCKKESALAAMLVDACEEEHTLNCTERVLAAEKDELVTYKQKDGLRPIMVSVKKAGAKTLQFRTEGRRSLKKLMNVYCKEQALDASTTEFFLQLQSAERGDRACLVDGSVLHVFERGKFK